MGKCDSKTKADSIREIERKSRNLIERAASQRFAQNELQRFFPRFRIRKIGRPSHHPSHRTNLKLKREEMSLFVVPCDTSFQRGRERSVQSGINTCTIPVSNVTSVYPFSTNLPEREIMPSNSICGNFYKQCVIPFCEIHNSVEQIKGELVHQT